MPCDDKILHTRKSTACVDKYLGIPYNRRGTDPYQAVI